MAKQVNQRLTRSLPRWIAIVALAAMGVSLITYISHAGENILYMPEILAHWVTSGE